MGIDGLLNLVKSITKREHISSFQHKTVGIDALPWLYKGCYATPLQIKDDTESVRFLYYMLEMLEILKFYNIRPIVVFDGRSLGMKKDTMQKRSKAKQQSKQKGLQLLQKGELQQARKYLSRCIIIDERIISTTMRVLKDRKIEFIVAPYEADTQLAKLRKLNIIDAAISEDSDLVVYGMNVLFKLNQNGDCDYVDIENCDHTDADNQFLKLYLSFPPELKIDSAILAGSDYSQSIHGIGIKRAIKLLSR